MIVRILDLTGQRFGSLVAMRAIAARRKQTYWVCRCDCGRELNVRIDALRRGTSVSCGCSRRRMPATADKRHGLSHTVENSIWRSIVGRCTIPSHTSYPRYGGRGITVCDRWLNDFRAFLADMGPRPSPDHSVEREKNDQPYSPENCFWATRSEQANNKRNSLLIEHNGQRKTTRQWAEAAGVEYALLWDRIKRGWSIERALSQPKRFVSK